MPFDWIRITIRGVIEALETDFGDFLQCNGVDDSGSSYVSKDRRFFHDVLSDPRDLEKYRRRFERFRALRNCKDPTAQPLLFVRVLDSTVELLEVEALHDALEEYFAGLFNPPVWLLVILDCQWADQALFFRERPRLVLHTISWQRGVLREYELDRPPFVTAYREAIMGASWHALGGWAPRGARMLRSLRTLLAGGDGVCPKVLRHVSLGEDLERYNYGIPQMPPDDALRFAMSESGVMLLPYVTACVQTRVEWEVETGNATQHSAVAEAFLRTCVASRLPLRWEGGGVLEQGAALGAWR